MVEWHGEVDSAGRIELPAPVRDWFEDGCRLRFYPLDHVLCGYLASEEVPHGTDVLHLDDRARLTIPSVLMEQAGIVGPVIVMATWNYFEVWSMEGWLGSLKRWEATEQLDEELLFDWPQLYIPTGQGSTNGH